MFAPFWVLTAAGTRSTNFTLDLCDDLHQPPSELFCEVRVRAPPCDLCAACEARCRWQRRLATCTRRTVFCTCLSVSGVLGFHRTRTNCGALCQGTQHTMRRVDAEPYIRQGKLVHLL